MPEQPKISADIIFRPFPDPDQPVPAEEIELRPASRDHRLGRRLADLVLEQGLDGLRRGQGTIQRIVVHVDPTLDDMLAAAIVQRLLNGDVLPEGIRPFAGYAAQVREGLKPGDLPLEDSLEGTYLAVRREAGPGLSDQAVCGQFLRDWDRLARRI